MLTIAELCDKYDRMRYERATTRAQIETLIRDAMYAVKTFEVSSSVAMLAYFSTWLTLRGGWDKVEAK